MRQHRTARQGTLTRVSEATGITVEVSLGISGDWRDRPLAVISGIAKGTQSMEATLREAVALARDQGASWDQIGKALGVSRQAAWERFSSD